MRFAALYVRCSRGLQPLSAQAVAQIAGEFDEVAMILCSHPETNTQEYALRGKGPSMRGSRRILPPLLLFCVSLSFLLGGCSGDGVIYTQQPKQPTDTVTNFGDSITCAYGATATALGYAQMLDAYIAKPSVNYCVPGQQAADMTKTQVYSYATPELNAHQLYTVMIGTNDALACGASEPCIANWSNALEASLVWLALPSADKTRGVDVTNRSSGWATDFGFGVASNQPGETLSFTVNEVTSGCHVFIGYRVFAPGVVAGGTANVFVDGKQVATLDTIPNSGVSIATQNGGTDTVYVAELPFTSIGSHTVTVSTTSAGFFSFMWAGTPSQNYPLMQDGSRVIVGGIPPSDYPEAAQRIPLYITPFNTVVGELQSDGLDVEIAPTINSLNPATDIASDGLHPNDSGHEKLFEAFKGVF